VKPRSSCRRLTPTLCPEILYPFSGKIQDSPPCLRRKVIELGSAFANFAEGLASSMTETLLDVIQKVLFFPLRWAVSEDVIHRPCLLLRRPSAPRVVSAGLRQRRDFSLLRRDPRLFTRDPLKERENAGVDPGGSVFRFLGRYSPYQQAALVGAAWWKRGEGANRSLPLCALP